MAPSAQQTAPDRRGVDDSAVSADVSAESAHPPVAGVPDIAGRGPRLDQSVGWLMAFLGFMIGSRVIADNSFFTHLATGNVILQTGSVPAADPYSFTALGEPWTVQSWLPSVVYRGLYNVFDLWAVRLFNGALCALLASSLWQLSKPARLLIPRVALVGAGITIGAMMWSPRPLLFGLLCLAGVVSVVELRKPLWWLLPIMWIWVNSHGSFPLALAFIGAAGLGSYLDTRERPVHELRIFGWTCAGLALAAINPVGPKLLIFPIQLLSRQEALKDVAEWKSPAFDRPSEWAFLLLIFAVVVAAKMGAKWRHVLPAFGFVVAGLLAVRNINPAAFVLVAASAPAFAGVGGTIDGAVRSLIGRAVAAVALVAFVGVGAVVASSPGGIDYTKFPVEQVDWLEAHDLVAQPDVNLVHRDTVGNYLELRFGSRARVFMDDRFDFYPQSVIDDHATLYFGGDFQQVLDKYEANAVLWEANSLFADWLRSDDSGWTVTSEGDLYVVAVPEG